ncbi:lysoplasmalogenase [Tenacibaculum sp. 190524A05c]|uniref:Membrane protein YhhN n=1 Tax=Tenacibaculum platacis TaxID=3137852 RepID=A0ABM9NY24_9FLAO
MNNQNKKALVISLLFLVVSVFEIYGTIQNSRLLEFIFKPLITVSLALLYIVSVKKPSFLFISALFFSFWGDVLLLFPEKYFVLGLVSFLLTHLIFIKIIRGFISNVDSKLFLKSGIFFVAYFGGIVYLIFENLNELLIPVLVYGLVISTFGTFATVNYVKNKATENLWLLVGALIFILSDSIIAINKFYMENASLGSLIMITYIVAQYLICKAMIAKTMQD